MVHAFNPWTQEQVAGESLSPYQHGLQRKFQATQRNPVSTTTKKSSKKTKKQKKHKQKKRNERKGKDREKRKANMILKIHRWIWVSSFRMIFFLVPSFCLQISWCHFFFFASKQHLLLCIYFIHSLVEGNLGCFQVLEPRETITAFTHS